MTEPEIIAALRLQNIPNIGDVTAKKLIAHLLIKSYPAYFVLFLFLQYLWSCGLIHT